MLLNIPRNPELKRFHQLILAQWMMMCSVIKYEIQRNMMFTFQGWNRLLIPGDPPRSKIGFCEQSKEK
jgi:hypothetical protein